MGLRGQREWAFRDNFGRSWRVWLPTSDESRTPQPARAAQGGPLAIRSLVFFAASHSGGDELGRAIVAMYGALSGQVADLDVPATGPHWREIEHALVDATRDGRLRVEELDSGLAMPAPVHAPSVATPPPLRAPPPTAIDTTWFSLEVVDEVGDAIDGLDIAYIVLGAKRVVTTNGAGIARIDGVAAGFASAAVVSLDAAREKLRPRWKEPRDPKKITDPTSIVREIGDGVTQPVSLECTVPRTLVITPYFKCHEIPGAHFSFGRSFVKRDATETLAGIAEDLSADDGRKGMVFGHTDLAGPDALNKELSERRAKAVFALFTHDADAWEELYSGTADGPNWKEKWDLEEAQHMMNALGVTDDAGHAVPENGVRDAATKQAIRRFQAGDYPDKPAEQAPLPPADFLGKAGRKELFLAYAKRVTRKPIPKGKFEKIGDAPFMGCGEFNPLSISVKDRESRRAVVFVFDGAAGPKALPCKLRSLGPCKSKSGPLPTVSDPDNPPYRCSAYKTVAKKCPCQGGADLSHDLILRFPIKLKEADDLPHTYVLESDDGTIKREKKLASDGRANDKERVEIFFEHLPLTHAYKVVCNDDGDPYELFEFAKLPELQERVKAAEHAEMGDSGTLNEYWIDNKDAPAEDVGAPEPTDADGGAP